MAKDPGFHQRGQRKSEQTPKQEDNFIDQMLYEDGAYGFKEEHHEQYDL